VRVELDRSEEFEDDLYARRVRIYLILVELEEMVEEGLDVV